MADPFRFNLGEIAPNAKFEVVDSGVDREADRMAEFFKQQLVFEKQMRAFQEKQQKAEQKVVASADIGKKVLDFENHVDGMIKFRENALDRKLNPKEIETIINSEYKTLGKLVNSDPLAKKYASEYNTILLPEIVNKYKPTKAKEQSSGIIGGLGDIALSLGQGAVGSVKALTDLAGGGNVASESLESIDKWLQENKTEASKEERKQVMKRIEEAQKSGSTLEEIKAYLQGFSDQPLEMLAQGIGSFATLGAGKAAQAVKLANMTAKGENVIAATNAAAKLGNRVNIALGTAQGVGEVKGSQYEVAFQEAKKKGLSDEQAAAIARDASSYTVDNAGRQLLGGALGLVATATGPIEKAILGKAIEKQGNALARISKGTATEALTEAAQTAQSTEAGNVAAIQAGLLDPSQRFRGVAGASAQAGLVGGILGGGADLISPAAQTETPPPPQPETTPVTPNPVAPTSARQAADWRLALQQGQVPPEISAWAQQNNVSPEEAVQIYQQNLGAPDVVPGNVLAAANGAPTKFFQGIDLDTVSQVEVPFGEDAITGPELVKQINEALTIVQNAQSKPKSSYAGYVDQDAVTEVTNAKEFLKAVQKSVNANPQILTQAKQAFVQKQAQPTQPATQPADQPVTQQGQPLTTEPPVVTDNVEQAVQQVQRAAEQSPKAQAQQAIETAAAVGARPRVSEEVNQILAEAAGKAPDSPEQILAKAVSEAPPEQQGIIIADEYRKRAEQSAQELDAINPEQTTTLIEAAVADAEAGDTEFTGLTNEADNIVRSIEEDAGQPSGGTEAGGVAQEADTTAAPADVGAAQVTQGETNAVQTQGQEAAQEVTPAEQEQDFLTELFGGEAGQQAEQPPTAPEPIRDVGALKKVLAEAKNEAEASREDWASRSYKTNKKQVELRGDGPSRQESISVSAINENRRKRNIDALNQEIAAINRIEKALEDQQSSNRFLDLLKETMQIAEQSVRDGTRLSKETPSEAFEFDILQRLNIKPAKGAFTSNRVSKALLRYMQGDVAGVAAQEADQQPEQIGSEQVAEEEKNYAGIAFGNASNSIFRKQWTPVSGKNFQNKLISELQKQGYTKSEATSIVDEAATLQARERNVVMTFLRGDNFFDAVNRLGAQVPRKFRAKPQGEANAPIQRQITEDNQQERRNAGEGLQGVRQDRNQPTGQPEGGDQAGGGNRVQQGGEGQEEVTQVFEARPFFQNTELSEGQASKDDAVNDAASIIGEHLEPLVLTEKRPDLGNTPMYYVAGSGNIIYNTSIARGRAADAQYMIEEVMHSLDNVSGTNMISASSTRLQEGGDIRTELVQSTVTSAAMSDILNHPLQSHWLNDDEVKAELFARSAMLYFAKPELLKLTAPKTHEAIAKIFDPTGTRDQQTLLPAVQTTAAKRPSQAVKPIGGGVVVYTNPPNRTGEQRVARLEEIRQRIADAFDGDVNGNTVEFGNKTVIVGENAEIINPEQQQAAGAIGREQTTIDVEARVVEETIAPQIAALPAPDVAKLENHYGAKSNTKEFLTKVKEDVVRFATQGAQAVSSVVRDIIKTIHAGVLSVAMIFNPTAISQIESFVVIPKETRTVTQQVLAEVPSEVQGMSDAGKQAYQKLIPALKNKIGDKFITIADKPSAKIFVFDSNGKLIIQKKSLFGLAKGDLYKGNNDLKQNRVTPAGLFGIKIIDAAKGGSAQKTAGEYDFGKVFALEDPDAVVTFMHSVWLKETDAAKRAAALKNESAEDSRYSFGCINVEKETFKDLVTKYSDNMDGSKLFVVPDNQTTVGDFLKKNVPEDKLVRESVEDVTQTTTTPVESATRTPGVDREVIGREERRNVQAAQTAAQVAAAGPDGLTPKQSAEADVALQTLMDAGKVTPKSCGI